MRLDEASQTGAKTLVTGCPFCILNFEDSAKGSEKDVEILDVVEIL
jgi:Fe-S oxidoreductase